MAKPTAATIARGILTIAEKQLAAGLVARDEIDVYIERATAAASDELRGVVVGELFSFLCGRMRAVVAELRDVVESN